MMARRSASLIRLQRPISSRVRPHPAHSPSSSTMHSLMQGDETAGDEGTVMSAHTWGGCAHPSPAGDRPGVVRGGASG